MCGPPPRLLVFFAAVCFLSRGERAFTYPIPTFPFLDPIQRESGAVFTEVFPTACVCMRVPGGARVC